MHIKRRDFLKAGLCGVATVAVGNRLGWLKEAKAATRLLEITITDALKDMVTHNAINNAQCYFWIYQMAADGVMIPPECPGPIIVATAGDTINVSITNALDEPHSFFIPGIFNSGPISAGATIDRSFTVPTAGSWLYYDNLNEPVNRMMGLHGALIVMPAVPKAGHKFTPYDAALVSPGVQLMYDEFGSSAHFPGLAWEQGDDTPWSLDTAKMNCPPFRQYVWLDHQASPLLFSEVGSLPPGQIYDKDLFVQQFLNDPFVGTRQGNRIPSYFTINGQSGMLAHFNPSITPMGRVGEPVVVHILNAGLWTHSMHLHANHFYVTSVNGVVSENPIWVDVYTVNPMDRIDYTIPFMRPPDLSNVKGNGLPNALLNTINGHPSWPPIEEFDMYMPPLGTKAKAADGITDVELGQRMSPLCFPMHDHSEPSQTSQGGNYNMGLISGIYFTGDRNGTMDFPMDEDFKMAFQNIRGIAATGMAAPPLGEAVM